MRALFLIPPPELNLENTPIDRVYGCNYGFDYKPAIHFLQVTTFARDKCAWSVRFLDCPAEGITLEAFPAAIEEFAPDVVLFWSTYLSAIEDIAAARMIQESNPSVRLVFMGTGATWKPQEFQLGPHSYCLLGEPEQTLLELNAAWQGFGTVEKIPGLAWYSPDGTMSRGPNRPLLDVTTLPMPDRRLLLGRYRANRLEDQPVSVMIASRGCGFRCTFCTTNAMDQAIDLEFKTITPAHVSRPPLRKRTVEQIIAEFEDMASLGIKSVEIADNIFTWGRSRTLAICKGIEPLNMKWICLARANMLHDAEVVRAMADAGCQMVYMGSESFDDGLLDDMVKEIKVKDVEKAVRVCRENGVEPEVSVLIGGSPHETWRTLLHSWRASKRLGTRFVHFAVALPSPSTQMYDDAMQNGWFIQGDFRPADNAREVVINLPHLSHHELQLALKIAYSAQYLTPSGVWKQIQRATSPAVFVEKAKAAKQLLIFLAQRSKTNPIPPGRLTPLPTASVASNLD